MLRCNMSLVTCQTLLMLCCNMSLVTCQTLLMLRCNMSLVTCQTLLMLRCNMSLVTCQTHLMLRCNLSLLFLRSSKSLGRKCFQVSHVKMEFTRKTRKRGHKTHGTQCIDKEWSALKRYIPKELCSKTPNGLLNEKIAEYVCSFVWRSNTLGKHQLKDLGKLAHKTWTA